MRHSNCLDWLASCTCFCISAICTSIEAALHLCGA